ncbi:sodium- and chloride-dependent glycine transporter 2 [Elysia marginata]|uniref:Sodium- and chloride-dependent glycine transporter 2 n=1 Tax=Elysia marginata TaxID=1093978 RepID=A0AAV4FN00_9GAST|nr:sodium- and chloride-dependent glycine transporter 2 [Elysia marginata]
MAAQIDADIKDVVKSGPGLAFIVYPEAVTHLPAPPFWAIAFFFMLILLGLDSQFAMVETLLSAILDQWPKTRKYKTLVILLICIGMLLLGLPLVTEGGAYLLNLMDTYAASYSLMTIGFVQSVAISYIYGAERFFQDMKIMYGARPLLLWKILWMFVSPALVLFILIFAIVEYSPATYGSYEYDYTGDILGWLMVAAAAFWIPFWVVYTLCTEKEGRDFFQKLKNVSTPNIFWGPALVKHRQLVDYVPGFVVDPNAEKEKEAYFNPAVSMSSVNVDVPNGKVDTRRFSFKISYADT